MLKYVTNNIVKGQTMNMKLSFFCEDTGYSKKDSPLWTDVCDALHQLRTNTGSINIEDVDNQKTLSIHSDGKHFLLSLIDGKDDKTKIKSIQRSCFERKISFASPVSWNRHRDLTGDFDFVTDVSRTFFITGQV
ncbi:hypothetical protein HWQ17_16610 [Enterobacter pasteurii]|nr:hypothetical protein HWQ17_16610 [Enterobacter pasteurii]